MKLAYKFFFLFVAQLIASGTFATDYIFTGSGTGSGGGSNVNTVGNWTPTPTTVFVGTGDTYTIPVGKSTFVGTSISATSSITVEGSLGTNNPNILTIASGGYLSINGSGQIKNNSGIIIADGGTLENNGTLNIDGDFTINGTFINDLNATLTSNGIVTVGSTGVIENNGTITIDAGTLTVSNGTFVERGTTTVLNGGTFTNNKVYSTSASVLANASFNTVTIQNGAEITFLGSAHIPSLTMTNGTIVLSSDTLFLGTFSGFSSTNTIKPNRVGSIQFDGAQTGTVYFDKTTPDTTNALLHLILNNASANISLGDSTALLGVLTPNSGTINTQDTLLRFISTSATSYAQLGTGAGSINGDIIYQMYVDSGYHQIGAAVADSIKHLNRGYNSEGAIYYWDAPTSYWTAADSTTLFTAGTGYYAYLGSAAQDFVYFFETPGVMELQGTPTRGSVSIPLYYHDGTGSNADFGAAGAGGWNLISNPYPSQLDWEAISLPANLNDAFYVYKPEDGSYTSYVSGSGTNGGTQYIPPMQAVFIQTNSALGAGTVNLNLDSTHRVTNQSTTFYKNGSPFETLRFNLKNLKYDTKDEHVLRFADGASDIFDRAFDAVKFENGQVTPNLYAKDINDKSYSINTLPVFDNSYSYPLTIHTKYANQQFSLGVSLEENTDHYRIYLEDKVLKKYHDLNSGDYTFISQVAEVNSSRFIVHIIKQRDITSVRTPEAELIGLRQTQEAVYLTLPLNNIAPAYLSLYDLQGKLIWSDEMESSGEGIVNLPTNLKGAYILKANYLGQEKSIKLLR